MNIYDIISKKRNKEVLTQEEINFIVKKYNDGDIPDYQMSALLMAIFLNDMNDNETLYFTEAIVKSGNIVDLSNIKGNKVDKHSTGGVGDSITLLLGPMIASCDVPFVKMSGRGLGHTGGTLDKLESIRDFKIDIPMEDFVQNANKSNLAICSQTANITPADEKIYALRDVTATVDSIPLIASSIMSKKLAINSDGILLDVKVGSGAFMKDLQTATKLAKTMVNIGNGFGRKTIAIVTNMDQPLGNAIGNSLEVKEAIETLKGKGPKDLYELALVLGSKLLVLADRVNHEEEGRELLINNIQSGKAYNKLLEMVSNQNGDISVIKNPDLLPKSKYIIKVESIRSGYIRSINAEKVGKCALNLGAGRKTLDSIIDLSAGIVLNKKIDDYVEMNEPLVYIHTNDMEKVENIKDRIIDLYEIGNKNKNTQDLILKEIQY